MPNDQYDLHIFQAHMCSNLWNFYVVAAAAEAELDRAVVEVALNSFTSSEAVYLARVAAALLGLRRGK
jgi:hypothetical protein